MDGQHNQPDRGEDDADVRNDVIARRCGATEARVVGSKLEPMIIAVRIGKANTKISPIGSRRNSLASVSIRRPMGWRVAKVLVIGSFRSS